MKPFNKALLLLAISTIMFSCKKNDTEPEDETTSIVTNNLIKLGETYIPGAKAKALIYSTKPLETGYNEIYVSFYDSIDGSRLNAGQFNIMPIMDMGTMLHGSPVENSEDTIATDGYFKSAVVFSMPGTAAQWSLSLLFHNHKNGLEGTGSIGVEVISSSPSKFKSTVVSLDNNRKVFISLISPKMPQVGINDFEVVLHEKASMMSYPTVEDYILEIVPEMPSMGHGSPNNINPVQVGNGHYVGKVNFTMTGLWNVKLNLYKNGILVSNDQYFEITLQ